MMIMYEMPTYSLALLLTNPLYQDAPTPLLALKLFKAKGSKRFQHEVHILQLLNQVSSRNIVKLLVAFSNQNTRGILFPWAECDLSEMMTRVIPHSERCDLGLWTLQQFIGLLDGLAAIHRISESNGYRSPTQCRHGDLRPANILVMRGSEASYDHPASIASCRLQIASMAMAQLFQDESQYTVPSETGTYQGPECYLGTAIGPLYDIWSLGGIFLEMIIWWLEGPSGLETFAEERIAPDPLLGERVRDDYFFTLNIEDERYIGAEVRPSVMALIKRLEQDERLSPAFVGLLSVIKSYMLVPIDSQRLGASELSRMVMDLVDSQRGDKEDVQSSI
ncbi:kinase-like domain-containing protein [Aspergillus arachidicola]|uniref:Kinase-like domain-containing protein n=1 Tax=Aspergillus arachidicola TaxID=656916 RepID=A0A5N6YAH6_9EURO|nr:kinase-like domain-containing protein [Aspergillus arachidicola]